MAWPADGVWPLFSVHITVGPEMGGVEVGSCRHAIRKIIRYIYYMYHLCFGYLSDIHCTFIYINSKSHEDIGNQYAEYHTIQIYYLCKDNFCLISSSKEIMLHVFTV